MHDRAASEGPADAGARSANLPGLKYDEEAAKLGPPVVPIVDIHSHLHHPSAARVYDAARRMFGVVRTYTMTQLPYAGPVRDEFGDSVRFIAFPTFMDPDKNAAHRSLYVRAIESFRADFGSRMLKLWASPRLRDLVPDLNQSKWQATDLAEVDSSWRVRACEVGRDLGMMYMIHIADPDVWFKSKYADASKYGTKRQQYEGFERMLDRFTNPWIAAHMGGWPEDLGFLDRLLSDHPNLYLDTSATKWIVRELGRHPTAAVRAFFIKWKGRILFGSDIVATDDHLSASKSPTRGPMADLADSPESALELYASRYYALRTMLETGYDGPSPIADPDLVLEDASRYTAMSAPRLGGLSLPREVLELVYAGNAARVVEAWWASGT